MTVIQNYKFEFSRKNHNVKPTANGRLRKMSNLLVITLAPSRLLRSHTIHICKMWYAQMLFLAGVYDFRSEVLYSSKQIPKRIHVFY